MALPPQPIGQSESFMTLMDRVSDVAALERPVLIAGERGTGKEMIASRLHFLSPRWEQIYVSVNCAAFDDDGLDRELFGETFMDGRADTNGRFYEAHHGTLFLDAVETMSLRLQEKLMKVIEYGQVQAAGELHKEDVDVRVVAATGVDLPRAVREGLFQGDLLDRLAFHVVTLPPLRTRPDDIDPLIEHFGRKVTVDLGGDRFPGFTAEAEEAILAHPFPGNVRELKLLVERSTVQAYLDDETLSQPIHDVVFNPFDSPHPLPPMRQRSAGHLTVLSATPNAFSDVEPSAPEGPTPHPATRGPSPDVSGAMAAQPETPPTEDAPAKPASLTDRVRMFEKRLVEEAMRSCDNHQGRAAEHLGLSYHQFRGLLRKHGLKK